MALERSLLNFVSSRVGLVGLIGEVGAFRTVGEIPAFSLVSSLVFGLLNLTSLQAEEGKYRYSITSSPEGAAVFVGTSYKGRTPYTSAWVSNAPMVSYTVLLPGYRTQTVALDGIVGSTAEGQVQMTPAGKPGEAECELLLEAIRAELAKTEATAEIEASFPLMGSYLTTDFKRRLTRGRRLIKASGRSLDPPFPPATTMAPWLPGARCAWEVNEILHSDERTISWMGSSTEYDQGEFVYGHAMIYVFAKEDAVWRLEDVREIGQDHGDDEKEN